MIEAVTGRDYFDHVRERVYAPAGMKNSDCYDIDLVVPEPRDRLLARSGRPRGQRWRANTFEHVIRGGPAGGGYSTARDLLAFAEALRSGRLVSRADRRDASGRRSPSCALPSTATASAWRKDPLGRSVGHSGGFPGISSVLDIYPETGVTVVVLSNVDGGMQPVARKIREVAGRLR